MVPFRPERNPNPYLAPFTAYPSYLGRRGGELIGAAAQTEAIGSYLIDTQQARLIREESRRSAIDTQKKRLQWEMEYERLRPKAGDFARREQAADLDMARNFAQNTEIWSGRVLNILLRSCLNSSAPGRGPSIPLSQEVLRGINLTDKTTRSNLTLAKDEGKINWTDTLEGAAYDEIRNRFSKNFADAMQGSQDGQPPSRAKLNDLRADLKKLNEKLDDQVANISPDDYIRSSRILTTLRNNVNGLSDPRLCKACNNNWRKNISTVGGLVYYCQQNGVEFGPASAPGDQPAYTTTYYLLRNYERGLIQLAQR
jgi:hypothetical protein